MGWGAFAYPRVCSATSDGVGGVGRGSKRRVLEDIVKSIVGMNLLRWYLEVDSSWLELRLRL